jgi:hypothetical protein
MNVIRSRIIASALCALMLMAPVLTVDAQSAPPYPLRVVQARDGTLYVTYAQSGWALVPDEISLSDLGALQPAPEVDGVIPLPTNPDQSPSIVRVIQDPNDGTLDLIEDSTSALLVPDPISDVDLAALNIHTPFNGTIPDLIVRTAIAGNVSGVAQSPSLSQPTPTDQPVSAPPAGQTQPPAAAPSAPITQCGPAEALARARDGSYIHKNCLLLTVGQTASATIGVNDDAFIDQVNGHVYTINLSKDKTYKIEMSTSNFFGADELFKSRHQLNDLRIKVQADNRYLLDPIKRVNMGNRDTPSPQSIWTGAAWTLIPNGGMICTGLWDRFSNGGIPITSSGLPFQSGANDCVFKTLADARYSLWVGEDLMPGEYTVAYGSHPQYSITVREAS